MVEPQVKLEFPEDNVSKQGMCIHLHDDYDLHLLDTKMHKKRAATIMMKSPATKKQTQAKNA
jgi:hypothetical protein